MKNSNTVTTILAITAELARVDAHIVHLEWFIKHAPAGVDRKPAEVDLVPLRMQRDNLYVDLRLATEMSA